MKINRIGWTNYKGLADGEIVTDGFDVTISGRNGTGKSSIAQIVPFVLFGKLPGSIKRYEGGFVPNNDGLIHGAEISFDDGTTLRREYLWTAQGNRQKFYVNGGEVNLSSFKTRVDLLTNGGGELVFDPFAFCALPIKERRNLLFKVFGAISDREILSTPKYSEVAQMFGNLTADVFIGFAKTEHRQAKTEAAEIPARIEELQRRLKDVPDVNAAEVAEKITAAKLERDRLLKSAPPDFSMERVLLKKRVGDLERQRANCLRQLETKRARRQTLLTEFRRVQKSAPGICPTCGQPIPQEKFNATRATQLNSIKADGQNCKVEIAELEEFLAHCDAELADATKRIAELDSQAQPPQTDERDKRLAELDATINSLIELQVQLREAETSRTRLETLETRGRELNKKIARLEGQLAAAEQFQCAKILLVEEKISSNFELVRFKLFERLITTDEIKPTCEATLNGVPFSALSKGEQLRAALDIFKGLQRHYGVEMPLIIDDAESYTANSFVDVSNQLWLFKVTDEEELSVKVERKATQAA